MIHAANLIRLRKNMDRKVLLRKIDMVTEKVKGVSRDQDFFFHYIKDTVLRI